MWRLLCIALLLFVLASCQEHKGDECTHERTQRRGVCRSLKECTFAVTELTLGHNPQICSFVLYDPIVCCPAIATKIDSYPLSLTRNKQLEECKHPKIEIHNPTLGGGGVKAIAMEFPHMAAIYYENDNGKMILGCGGSLINERYILTAAHCLYTKDFGEPKTVRLGDLNVKSIDDNARPQEYNVSKLIEHPNYDPPQNYHDIGLIKLDRDVVFDEYVRPVCLESRDYNTTGLRVSATGWGQTRYLGNTADHLMEMKLEVFDAAECQKYYESASKKSLPKGIVEEVQLCAGRRDKRVDTCRGDSGGPLQVKTMDMYSVIGVTSFGKACLLTDSPGVYTKVSNYVDWIQKTVSD